MGKDTPLISIVMPAFNVEKMIGKTIESILNQSYTNWELVIVNDGSTDNTLEVIRVYAAQNANIICYSIPNSGSATTPRLYAVEKSHGDWICNIDSDDTIEPTYLEKLLQRAIDSDADIVSPTMRYTDKVGNVQKSVPNQNFDITQVVTGKKAAYLTFCKGAGSAIACNGMLCKKKIYNVLLPKSDKKYIYQDEVDFLQLFCNAQKVAFSNATYYYLMNDQSVTHTPSTRSYDKLITEIEYNAICRQQYSNDKDALKLANRRYLDVTLGRRMKYLHDRAYFTKEQKSEVLALLKQNYRQKPSSCGLPLAKRILLFSLGFYWFLFISNLIYGIKRR